MTPRVLSLLLGFTFLFISLVNGFDLERRYGAVHMRDLATRDDPLSNCTCLNVTTSIITITSTVYATPTSSSLPTNTSIPTCTNGTLAGDGPCECSYKVSCNTQLSSASGPAYIAPNTTSFADCLAFCDSSDNCFSVTYQISTNTCSTFHVMNPGKTAYDSDYESAVFVEDSCSETGVCSNAFKMMRGRRSAIAAPAPAAGAAAVGAGGGVVQERGVQKHYYRKKSPEKMFHGVVSS